MVPLSHIQSEFMRQRLSTTELRRGDRLRLSEKGGRRRMGPWSEVG